MTENNVVSELEREARLSGEKDAGGNGVSSAKKQSKRTGKTAEHYKRQKSMSYAYFRVKQDELGKIKTSQFTIYDFISNSFSFSSTKKELTIKVLEALKKKPMTFLELCDFLQAKKSTLYLLCLALARSGLIDRENKRKPFHLSTSFSTVLREYSYWWENWVRISTASE
ncbi:hypothetical protein HY993_00910 [Candidatus Micrarchaeota archaeon]|nr:hypothetical protein [Candidatus Micrarchaeota archaeon]